MQYVIYEPSSGGLLGAYIQDLQPEHADHYIEVIDDLMYQNWTSYRANAARDGLEPAPIVIPPTPVPQEVRSDQIAIAALEAGHWDGILSYFAGLPDDAEGKRARIRFERRPTVRRDCDLVAAAADALALSSTDVDDLFIAAASLK
jgi:hypothetical protein